MLDIEDDETNFFGSFKDYAALHIANLERAIAVTKSHRGDLDTSQFIYSPEVMSLIAQHFEGRLKVTYVRCVDGGEECETHDGHLTWERRK